MEQPREGHGGRGIVQFRHRNTEDIERERFWEERRRTDQRRQSKGLLGGSASAVAFEGGGYAPGFTPPRSSRATLGDIPMEVKQHAMEMMPDIARGPLREVSSEFRELNPHPRTLADRLLHEALEGQVGDAVRAHQHRHGRVLTGLRLSFHALVVETLPSYLKQLRIPFEMSSKEYADSSILLTAEGHNLMEVRMMKLLDVYGFPTGKGAAVWLDAIHPTPLRRSALYEHYYPLRVFFEVIAGHLGVSLEASRSDVEYLAYSNPYREGLLRSHLQGKKP